jgi:exodeoxyribonuclease VII small subunit
MSERREDEGVSPAGLEDRLGRIESIVDRLERDDLELQEALDLFEEGIAHVREAYAVLDRSRLHVEKLVVELDGAVTLERDTAGE